MHNINNEIKIKYGNNNNNYADIPDKIQKSSLEINPLQLAQDNQQQEAGQKAL